MTMGEKLSLFALRLALGCFYLYAGVTKLMDPAWSAEGYIKTAKNFIPFYQWLLQPNILPIINFMNEWGLTLLGASLILGLFVRLSSVLGAVLMLMYYLVILDFPYPNAHAYIIDEHIIYIFVLIYFVVIRAGRYWGLDDKYSPSGWLG